MVWNDPSYKTISGVFNSERQVEDLLNALEDRGIGRDRVDILMSDKTRDRYSVRPIGVEKESKLPEGTSLGGVSGGLLGALIGGLTMAGSLFVPGLNLLVAGPIIGAIAGGTIGSATGGLVGALVGAGIPEYEAKTYENELKEEGNVLVVAHILMDEVDAAKDLFKRYGARDTSIEIDAGAPSSILR